MTLDVALEDFDRFSRIAEHASTEVRLGAEPEVYRLDGEHSFWRDLLYQREDFEARRRLNRHREQQERAHKVDAAWEGRATDSTKLAGLVPPGWALEATANLPRAGRPFLDAVVADGGGSRCRPPARPGRYRRRRRRGCGVVYE
jgi:hypothetical protein